MLVEIVNPSYVYSRGVLSTPSQEVFLVLEPGHSPPLLPPPPPTSCYSRCGFTSELASSLRSYASVISTRAPTAFEAASIKPATSKELPLASKSKGKQKAHSLWKDRS